MKSEKEIESDSTEASKNPALSLSLVNNYETPHEKIKFPYKKYNYKSYLYKNRIKYGHLSQIGVTNDKLRFLPTLDIAESNQDKKISEFVRLPNEINYSNDQNNLEFENNYYLQKLFYNSDFNLHRRKSKREIKLSKMLDDKIKQLCEIIKK